MSNIKKAAPDWERIEVEFRAGMLSNAEIGRMHGISETAIRKRAKAHAWEKDLTAKVDAKVRAALVRAEVRASRTNERARTEKEVVDDAVATKVGAVLGTRSRVSRFLGIMDMLEAQIVEAIEHRPEIMADIEIVTAGDKTVDRQMRMMRAVSLPSHVTTVKELSIAFGNFTKIERQAFGLSDGEDAVPPEKPGRTDRDDEAARNALLLETLRARTRGATDAVTA